MRDHYHFNFGKYYEDNVFRTIPLGIIKRPITKKDSIPMLFIRSFNKQNTIFNKSADKSNLEYEKRVQQWKIGVDLDKNSNIIRIFSYIDDILPLWDESSKLYWMTNLGENILLAADSTVLFKSKMFSILLEQRNSRWIEDLQEEKSGFILFRTDVDSCGNKTNRNIETFYIHSNQSCLYFTESFSIYLLDHETHLSYIFPQNKRRTAYAI